MANYQKLEVYKCDFLNVRKGPSMNYKIFGELYPPQIVEVESKKGNWARIRYKGGFAWCSLLYLREITWSNTPVNAKVMKATASINIRKTSEWSGIVIDTVAKDYELWVTNYAEGNDKFSQVWYANNYAYVPSKYLSDTGRTITGSGQTGDDNNEGELPSLPIFAETPRYNVEYKNKWWIECYSPEYPGFFFNTSALGMPLIEKPMEELALLKTEAVDTIQYNGDIIHAEGTYSTTEMELEFFVLKENYNVVVNKLRQLCQMREFRLICGWDRSYFKRARLASNIEIEEFDFDELGYKITIEFILQPFRYDLNGAKFVKDRRNGKEELEHKSEIFNPFGVSLPKLYIQVPHKSLITSNADGIKAINTRIWHEFDNSYVDLKLLAHSESYNGKPIKFINVVVDCENEVIYEDTTNRNFNHLLTLDCDFPVLKPGLIKIFQGVEPLALGCKVKIVPNWREL